MDFFFLFTAKYNRFPVLLITPKHIMYIQLTSPLSHSQFLDWIGIIFQDFHLHNEKKRKEKEKEMKIWVKLNKARKKETDKSLHMVAKDTGGDMKCGRSESKPGIGWFYTMTRFQRQEGCQFSAVVTKHHIGNMAHWRLACTLTTSWKRDLTTCRVARGASYSGTPPYGIRANSQRRVSLGAFCTTLESDPDASDPGSVRTSASFPGPKWKKVKKKNLPLQRAGERSRDAQGQSDRRKSDGGVHPLRQCGQNVTNTAFHKYKWRVHVRCQDALLVEKVKVSFLQ